MSPKTSARLNLQGSPGAPAPDLPPGQSPPREGGTGRSLRTASLAAGSGLLGVIVLSVFSIVVLGGLGTPGDVPRATQALAGSGDLFRWGVLSLFLVAVLDVIVAAALLELFAPVNRTVSTLAAWFRTAYAAVFLVAISQLVGALPLSGDASQVAERIRAFDDIWHAGLILFGIHLMLIGYLTYRSAFAPRIIGILLVVAGLGYLTDSFGVVLIPDYPVSIAQFTFVGEAALMCWLLIKGRRVSVRTPGT